MYCLVEQTENTSEGRLKLTEGLYNLVSNMQQDGETLSGVTPVLQSTLRNIADFESLSSKRKEMEDALKDTESERTSKKPKETGNKANTPTLEGYEVIDWTVSYSVREHDCPYLDTILISSIETTSCICGAAAC